MSLPKAIIQNLPSRTSQNAFNTQNSKPSVHYLFRVHSLLNSWTEPALSEAEWDARIYRDILGPYLSRLYPAIPSDFVDSCFLRAVICVGSIFIIEFRRRRRNSRCPGTSYIFICYNHIRGGTVGVCPYEMIPQKNPLNSQCHPRYLLNNAYFSMENGLFQRNHEISLLSFPFDARALQSVPSVTILRIEYRIQHTGDRIRQANRKPGQQGAGDQDSRESGGKERWNIEYRTRNVQCRSVSSS